MLIMECRHFVPLLIINGLPVMDTPACALAALHRMSPRTPFHKQEIIYVVKR